MNPREELLQIQKVITENIREDIKAFQGRQLPLIRRYAKAYSKEFKRLKGIIDKGKLLKKIIRSDIVYIGDYHTLDQSQKTIIKILRDVIKKRPSVTIAMEMINHENQGQVDDFMAQRISEQEFLDAIDYYRNWGFPWRNYKPIFDFAKINKVKILGLNCKTKSGSEALKERDECAAGIIAEETKKEPENLLLVLYGDLHVTERYIPRKTDDLLRQYGLERKYIIVFQNSEELYWRLAEEGREHATDVVKISKRKYCIMNTPPWIKLQTYLNWLEHAGELLLSPKGIWEEEEAIDYFHQISNLISAVSSFLDIKGLDLTEFHLYTSEEVEFVDFINGYMKRKDDLSLKEVDLIRGEIIYDGICLIPDEKVIYLSNLSINKVAEKVAQLLAYNTSGFYPTHTREGDRDYFYSRILIEAIGFIGSKIINFKRKSSRLKDFEEFMANNRGKRLTGRLSDQRTISSLVIEHKHYEERIIKRSKIESPCLKKALYHQSARIFLGVTKSLGYIIGNRLFIALMRGKVDKHHIKALFSYRPKKEGDSFRKYMEIVRLTDDVKERFRTKSDRF